MSDEGWEVFRGLATAGYRLHGYGIQPSLTDVADILRIEKPNVVMIQDKREWDLSPRDFRCPFSRFMNYYRLGLDPNVFKVTILKDSHQRPEYHRRFLEEIGCHAVIHYYHPRIVQHLAPYVRPQHMIHTYHTLDPAKLPTLNRRNQRRGALLSGAVSNAYPVRQMLRAAHKRLPLTDLLPHPGYHRRGCQTKQYLETLNTYSVAICTASIYGYALRKMIEATATGCIVLTNLPTDEVMPHIDGNLVRLREPITVESVSDQIREVYASYDEERQFHYAHLARVEYAYQLVCRRLADDIETMRKSYHVPARSHIEP